MLLSNRCKTIFLSDRLEFQMVFGIILTLATTCLISSSDVCHRTVVQVLPLFLFKSSRVNCNSYNKTCLAE
jgi:hypothetical protein